jgi:hypothetical protein
MVAWSARQVAPGRVVDPGVGTGRFLVAAGREFSQAALVGVDIDPLAALLARAHLNVAGLGDRSTVLVMDFRSTQLPEIEGPTLYLGNPPYVRHHQIAPEWKTWFKAAAAELNVSVSALAGLHLHFFAAIAKLARAGDYGALITAAEWLDVNYGRFLRDLLVSKFGGVSVLAIEPDAEPFPGTAATAAITTFKIGALRESMRFSRVSDLAEIDSISGGRRVRRERLIAEPRWSHFTRSAVKAPEGFVELGELCRVHRGQVTGANDIWIAGDRSRDLPERVLYAAVTRARELFAAGSRLSSDLDLRRVIDIPPELEGLEPDELRAVERFLAFARSKGAHEGYVARHRRAWWSVGLRQPAPILATYMARRPPAFVLNDAGARHINVAHGLYPRDPMSPNKIQALSEYLNRSASLGGGRVYAGGLTKFEPREMERFPVPSPGLLGEVHA